MEQADLQEIESNVKVQEIISHLKFLSKVQPGEKINVRDFYVRDNDQVLQRFLRTIHNFSTLLSSSEIVESKEATLFFIQNTVNNAISIIGAYYNKDDFKQRIANIIIGNLEASKSGIRNLIATYQGDRKFISNAEAVMQTLEARIKSMQTNGYMNGISNKSFMPETLDDR